MDNQNHLENLNFTNNQTLTYKAVLIVKKGNIKDLSLYSGLSRQSCRTALKSLVSQGYIHEEEDDGKTLFSPTPAASLGKEKMSEFKQKLAGVEDFMKTIQNEARMFEFSTLNSRDEIGKLNLQSYSKGTENNIYMNHYSNLVHKYGKKSIDSNTQTRMRNNVNITCIRQSVPDLTKVKGGLCSNEKELRDVYFAPKQMSFEQDVWIFHDKVVFIENDGSFRGSVITSQGVSDTFRSMAEAIITSSQHSPEIIQNNYVHPKS